MNGRSVASDHLLGAAVAYARAGVAVFPCHGVASSGCTCGRPSCSSPGKHPRTPRGLQDASSQPATVERWWARWPAANIGVRTGTVSGLVVIDVDPEHGGDHSLRALVATHASLPKTTTVITGSGGLHLYFAHPGGRVRNSAGTRLGPGLDVRGDGGYVIAPPSAHVAGGHYGWAPLPGSCELPGDLAPLPDWLLGLVRPAPPRISDPPTRRPQGATAWARAAFDGEIDRVRRAPEGQRNHTLNLAAFALGQLVGSGYLNAEEVSQALVAAGQQAGLGRAECEGTVQSGINAGVERPRHPSDRGLGRPLPARPEPTIPELGSG